MKKVFFLVLFSVVLLSCSKDDDFDFDKNIIIGKWVMTKVEVNGEYVDITKPPYSNTFKKTYAIFYEDGRYSGHGYFGNGSGTYKTSGKTITTYLDGEAYTEYYILKLTETECELRMTMEGESINIICLKE